MPNNLTIMPRRLVAATALLGLGATAANANAATNSKPQPKQKDSTEVTQLFPNPLRDLIRQVPNPTSPENIIPERLNPRNIIPSQIKPPASLPSPSQLQQQIMPGNLDLQEQLRRRLPENLNPLPQTPQRIPGNQRQTNPLNRQERQNPPVNTVPANPQNNIRPDIKVPTSPVRPNQAQPNIQNNRQAPVVPQQQVPAPSRNQIIPRNSAPVRPSAPEQRIIVEPSPQRIEVLSQQTQAQLRSLVLPNGQRLFSEQAIQAIGRSVGAGKIGDDRVSILARQVLSTARNSEVPLNQQILDSGIQRDANGNLTGFDFAKARESVYALGNNVPVNRNNLNPGGNLLEIRPLQFNQPLR